MLIVAFVSVIEARLIRRYKRFLADVRLSDGREITVFCPNTGAMTGCMGEGRPVLLSESDDPARKYRYTWEMVHNGRCWIGINSGRANAVVEEALRADRIPEFPVARYAEIKREARFGEHTRFDFFLRAQNTRTRDCYIEVKSVTLVEDGVYMFPDTVSERGQKHLRELMRARAAGFRAVVFFLIQRSDGSHFEPARGIDPEYARLLRAAKKAGVEVLAYRARVGKRGTWVEERVRVKV